MVEVNEIRKNYERFDDTRIRSIAKNDVKGLREEVIPILIEEIKKRNLDDGLIEWINAESRKLSKSELGTLKRKVKQSICESCKENRQLKGYEFTTTIGMLIATITSDYKLILCEKCGRERRRASAFWTAILGWFSARGLILTPFALISKIKASIQEDKQSEQIIESFIKTNIGKITIEKDSEEVIQKLLKEFNGLEDFDSFEEEKDTDLTDKKRYIR